MSEDKEREPMATTKIIMEEKQPQPQPESQDGKWKIWIIVTQLVITCVIIPWGVWSTRQIFAFEAFRQSTEKWISSRPPVPVVNDLELLKLKTKDEVKSELVPKLDNILNEITKLDLKIERHMAESKTKP